MRLADLNDAGHFYNRGLFLSLCKSSGLGMNCVDAKGQYSKAPKLGRLSMYAFFEANILSRIHGIPFFHQVDNANPLPLTMDGALTPSEID